MYLVRSFVEDNPGEPWNDSLTMETTLSNQKGELLYVVHHACFCPLKAPCVPYILNLCVFNYSKSYHLLISYYILSTVLSTLHTLSHLILQCFILNP